MAKNNPKNKIISLLRQVDDPKIKVVEENDTSTTEIIKPTAQQLLSELSKSVCTLFFYKITDGTIRKMRCTLNENAFSEKYSSNRQIKNKIISDFTNGKHNKQGLVPVWDMDSSSWKSFYINRVYKLIRNEQTSVE
jgi:hypothetical protein